MAGNVTAKPKKITIRLTKEDWIAVRDRAYAQGEEMGPMVARWIGLRIKRLKAQKP